MRVQLAHRSTNAVFAAALCTMTPDHLSRARESWLAEFERLAQTGAHNDDSILWERGFMSGETSGQPALCGHVVLSDARIEGVVITDPNPQPSRLHPGAILMYVRYLATAPWNRDGSSAESGYLGIGRLLVARAVLDSVGRGHDGRLGLHSFPAAIPFYRALGFDVLGPDPAERGMTFAELPPKAVVTALADLGAHLVHNPEIF